MKKLSRSLMKSPIAALCLLSLLSACGNDSPTGPSGFDITRQFTAEQATVEKQSDGTVLVRLVGLTFETGTATLTAGSEALLDKFAQVFPAYSNSVYEVQAHTDSRGSDAYNMRLSDLRAEAVRNYLVETVGGPSAAITADGYGETRPLDTNETAEGRARNRRVEVWIRPAS